MQSLFSAEAVPGVTPKQLGLDIAERTFIVALFGHFAYAALSHYVETAEIISILMVAAETLPVVFIMTRAPSNAMSEHPMDWLLGILGTTMPLLVLPASTAHAVLPQQVCVLVVVTGIYVQVSAKLILGRSFGVVAANRGVRSAGPYRIVRHPMYAGYTLTHIGVFLAMPGTRTALFYGGTLVLQILRILREERILMRDAAYRDLAAKVRYRLLPGIY